MSTQVSAATDLWLLRAVPGLGITSPKESFQTGLEGPSPGPPIPQSGQVWPEPEEPCQHPRQVQAASPSLPGAWRLHSLSPPWSCQPRFLSQEGAG